MNENTIPARIEDFPELPMAGSRDMTQYEPGDAQIGAAMLWLTRLREAGETTNRPFERWLAEHPAHAFAFAEAEALFAFAAQPAKKGARHYHRHAPVKAKRRRWPAALGGLAACLGLLLVLPATERLRFLGADAVAAPGEIKAVLLSDGSRITLNTASALDIDVAPDRRHVTLRGGEAWFEIARDPARPFTVDTGLARIRVLGTRFNVRIDGDQVIVGVGEGKVQVARIGGRGDAAVLTPGQELIVDDRAMQRQTLDAFASGAWRRREIVVRREPLRVIVDELNRYRAADIYVLNGALGESRVSGVFRTDDPRDAVRTLERALGVRSYTLPTGQTFLY